MSLPPKPLQRPRRPFFSSGPTAKAASISDSYQDPYGVLNRSHRSKAGERLLKDIINKSHQLLNLPHDYKIGITPGSATGAFEMALWNLLGVLPVDVCAWDYFGQLWIKDIKEELALNPNVFLSDYGVLPDFSRTNSNHDIVFTLHGTTSGVMVSDFDWISHKRKGLTFCDGTSGVFGMNNIPWEKLDVTTWSWQKALGSEGGFGMCILSPRAIKRLLSYRPPWGIPKVLGLPREESLLRGFFAGKTLNTPSMLAALDMYAALKWSESIGGLDALVKKTHANAEIIHNWVLRHPSLDFLAKEPASRCPLALTIRLTHKAFLPLTEKEKWQQLDSIGDLLESHQGACDVINHHKATPCLRLWAGPTIEEEDIARALPWIDWVLKEHGYS